MLSSPRGNGESKEENQKKPWRKEGGLRSFDLRPFSSMGIVPPNKLKGDEEATAKATGEESFFPLDITISILSRVPGSSLIVLKPVCSLWNSILHRPHFIKAHLNHASKVHPPPVLIFSQEDTQGQKRYHLTLIDQSWKQKYRLTRASDAILITPPCNGLICLYDYRRSIQLCNPTTRELFTLPRPTMDYPGVANNFPKCFLGHHPAIEEYKVVRFFYIEIRHSTRTYNLGCEVFTLGTHSWKYIGNIHWYITGSGINIDGSIYWTSGVRSTELDRVIGFDLKHEKFRVIPPPEMVGYQNEIKGTVFLVQLEGNLCLVNSPCSAPGAMDIWVLKNMKDNLWIHRFHIPIMDMLGFHTWPEPVIVHKDMVLVRWGTSLYYHNLHGEHKVQKVYSDELITHSVKVYGFVESLVPLKG